MEPPSHSPADRDERLAGGALEGDGEGVCEPRAVLRLRLGHHVQEAGLPPPRRGKRVAYGNLSENERFRESALFRSVREVAENDIKLILAVFGDSSTSSSLANVVVGLIALFNNSTSRS